MAEAKVEAFCKIEKEENSSFEIETLPDDECNFVNQYIESRALSKSNELMTQTHFDKLPPSETIQPPCEEKSSSPNEPVAETLPSISASNMPASLASNAKLDPLADEFLPRSNTPIPTPPTPNDVPLLRPDDTDPACVYSAVIPSAAMTKTNVTRHEDSASAPAHTSRFDNLPRVSENSEQDSIGVSHMILSYEVPIKQLPDENSEKAQVCAQDVRSPSEKISTIKLNISDKCDDLLYSQDNYKRPDIAKQTISHQKSSCLQIILLLLSIIMYTMLNCTPNLVSSVHKNHALVKSSLDSDMGLAHEMEPTFRHTYWLYQQLKSSTHVGEPPPITLLGFNIVVSSINMNRMRQTLYRTSNTLSVSYFGREK